MRTVNAAAKNATKYTEAGAEESSIQKIVKNIEKRETSAWVPSAPKRVLREITPKEYIRSILGEVDEIIDEAFDKGGVIKFDMMAWMNDKGNLNETHAQLIRDFYEPQLAEIQEAISKTDEQLVEGYSYLKATELKKMEVFFQSLIDGIDGFVGFNKRKKILNRKPRVKKPIAAAKQVKSLKYLKESEEYKVVSVQPELIVGASQVWTFNAYTRVLTVYNALDRGGFKIKGCAILSFDEKTSISKKLRNPERDLKVVVEGGKVQLRKLMESLSTKEAVATGRLNAKTVILKVVK